MVMDRHGRSHRAKGLPQGYAGTYDGGHGRVRGMDVTPPASYCDGRMGEAERADRAEGMDAMRDRHVDAPTLPHGLKPGRWHDEFGMNTSHAGQIRRLLGDDPVEGSISSVAGMFPGPNARLYADFVRHPRRRTYTLEGETMTRSQARDYARGMLVESARDDAGTWGDGYDPDAMAEQAGDWFDRTYPMPKRR